jgi:hypothetical protein
MTLPGTPVNFPVSCDKNKLGKRLKVSSVMIFQYLAPCKPLRGESKEEA